MEIPSFIRDAKSSDILVTKFNQILMVEHVEINVNCVKVYYYFVYDYKDGMIMNEWLSGFYGPKFSEDFYREATEDEKKMFMQKLHNCGYELITTYNDRIEPYYTHYSLDEQLFNKPDIDIKDSPDVASRMKNIDDDLKPIANFIIDYASWELHKDKWNQPVLEVPLFRVLDALMLRGEPYRES